MSIAPTAKALYFLVLSQIPSINYTLMIAIRSHIVVGFKWIMQLKLSIWFYVWQLIETSDNTHVNIRTSLLFWCGHPKNTKSRFAGAKKTRLSGADNFDGRLKNHKNFVSKFYFCLYHRQLC